MSFKRQLKCHTLFEVSLTLPYAKQTMTWLCLSKAPRPWSYRGLRNLKKRRALFLDHPGSCSARLWARCVHSSHSVHLCRSSVYHSSRKSLQRLYRHLLNEQVNKWTFAPILEMEETRPREIQVNLSPHILCVCVCFYFNESAMNKNDKWCFREWRALTYSDGQRHPLWRTLSPALPSLGPTWHGRWQANGCLLDWSQKLHVPFRLWPWTITLPRFSPLQTARNDLN